jgi:hypothetical protein
LAGQQVRQQVAPDPRFRLLGGAPTHHVQGVDGRGLFQGAAAGFFFRGVFQRHGEVAEELPGGDHP